MFCGDYFKMAVAIYNAIGVQSHLKKTIKKLAKAFFYIFGNFQLILLNGSGL